MLLKYVVEQNFPHFTEKKFKRETIESAFNIFVSKLYLIVNVNEKSMFVEMFFVYLIFLPSYPKRLSANLV